MLLAQRDIPLQQWMSVLICWNVQKKIGDYQVHADLRLLDGNDLPFSDDTFDLVISRDVTWTLQQPEETLLEWRVAKPEDKFCILTQTGIIIFFDEEWMKLHLEKRKDKKSNGLPIHDKGKVMEEIMKRTSNVQKVKTNMDLDELPQLGFRNVKALKI